MSYSQLRRCPACGKEARLRSARGPGDLLVARCMSCARAAVHHENRKVRCLELVHALANLLGRIELYVQKPEYGGQYGEVRLAVAELEQRFAYLADSWMVEALDAGRPK